MRVSTMGRLTAAAALACSFGLAAAGGAAASPPRWSMTEVNLPSVVHNGSSAGYRVTIANAGPSNISTLYLVTKTTAAPVYVAPDPTHGTCTQALAGPLKCSFGAVNAGDSVTVTVAYQTPTSGTSFDPVFQGNSNGATFSDSRGTSHGDTLQTGTPQPTTLTSSKDFGGGFDIDAGAVSTDPLLSKKNIQATSVTPPVPAVVAAVEDNPAGTTDCPGCGSLLGEWAEVTVGDGQPFQGSPLFPISMTIYGKSVPLKLSDPTVLAKIGMVHVHDGIVDTLNTPCPASGPILNCVTATVVAGNLVITGWVDENGRVRGVG